MSLLFLVQSPSVSNCATLCAHPLSNGAAIMLWVFAWINLTPTHLFLYSFYIIPRRFYAASGADDMKLDDSNRINQPLVEAYLVEDEWHNNIERTDENGRSLSRRGSKILQINTTEDGDSNSSFHSRLLS